jgi:hypothetical protein
VLFGSGFVCACLLLIKRRDFLVIRASARVFDLLTESSRLDWRLGCATAHSQNGRSQKGAHT